MIQMDGLYKFIMENPIKMDKTVGIPLYAHIIYILYIYILSRSRIQPLCHASSELRAFFLGGTVGEEIGGSQVLQGADAAVPD